MTILQSTPKVKLKLRAVIPDEPGNASNFWRIIRPFEMLRKLGHDAKAYTTLDFDCKDAIVIIHRMIPNDPKKYVKDFRRKGAKAVLFSADDYTIGQDAIRQYLQDAGGLTSLAIERILGRISREVEAMSYCDGIVVSTLDLGGLVWYHVQKPLVTLPNAIDEAWFLDSLNINPEYIGNSNLVYIGYASGRRPPNDLEAMAKAWKRIGEEFDNVRFVVAGWQHDIIDSLIDLDKKIRIPFRPIEEYPQSMQVDIGCCPLADTVFNRGKSPIKYFEYSLAGAAVVASNLVYDQVIVNVLDGYLVDNDIVEMWYDRLKYLVTNAGARKAMVERANYGIHNYYSLEASIKDWESRLGLFQ